MDLNKPFDKCIKKQIKNFLFSTFNIVSSQYFKLIKEHIKINDINLTYQILLLAKD